MEVTAVNTSVLGGIKQQSSLDISGLHPAIVVKPWDSKPSKSRTAIVHSSCATRDYISHNNSVVNLLRALNERVYYVEGKDGLVECPRGQPGNWQRMRWISKRLAKTVVLEHPGVRELTCSEFVAQCPAHKRVLYSQAAKEFNRRGVFARDARLGAFVKFEKIESKPSRVDPCPRLIQPRSPVFNVALGRYTRAVEERLFHAVQLLWEAEMGGVGPVVMKGLDIGGVAAAIVEKWQRFKVPVAVGLDAKRFDQHVSVDALKWEHSVYNGIFNSQELSRLLRMQLINRGSAFLDGFRVDYQVEGTRSSGDMNTGLGNCLIMSSLVLLYCKELGITVDLANNGDDCVVFMERSDLTLFTSRLEEWFLSFGFEMEVERPVYSVEEIEFCQMNPLVVGEGYTMVRNPFAAISKDTMCLGMNYKAYPDWVRVVGQAGLSLYGDIPCFATLYSRMAREGKPTNIRNQGIMETGFLRMCRGGIRGPVLDVTRVSFYAAFGIWPALQRAIEDKFDQLQFGGGLGCGKVDPILFSDRLGNYAQ